MAVTTVQNILDFYKAEGEVFDRILPLSENRELSKHVVAFWMSLQTAGFCNLIALLKKVEEGHLLRIVREAEAILRCLKEVTPRPEDRRDDLILTARMVCQDINLDFFYSNRDNLVRGMVSNLDGASRVIFQDELRLAARSVNGGGTVPVGVKYALMRGYVDRPESSPEESRTMIITFVVGHAVGPVELTQYFTGRWGPCVGGVTIESGPAPIHAWVVFNTPSLLPLVLSGTEEDVEFVINGHQLWARVYVPQDSN